jgi:hypothetical protein
VRLYECLRKRRTRGGDHSRAFHARLLPPARISWRGRPREPQPLGAAIQSLAIACFDCIPVRWFSTALLQEILHKEEQSYPRILLDCRGCRDSRGPVSSTGRHPHRRIEGVWYGKAQMVMGASRAGRTGSCLVLFVVPDHTQGSAAAHAPNERQPVPEPIQPRRVQRPNGPSFVPDMTRLFAGGLRSRGSTEAGIRQTHRSGRMGADFAL